MKTTVEKSAPAAGGTRKKAASKAIIPESKIEKTTMFQGVRFGVDGAFRCRIPEAILSQPMERKDTGLRVAVVIVETSHLVVEVTAPARVVESIDARCAVNPHWRKSMGKEIYSRLIPEIRRVEAIHADGKKVDPAKDFPELMARVECYGDLRGFKPARVAFSIEQEQWEQVAALADTLGVKLEKLLRARIWEEVARVAAFEAGKARGGIEFVKGNAS